MSIENSTDTHTNLRIMNWMEIIDNVFHLYRKHFLLFIGISIIYFIVDSVEDKLFKLLWKNNPYGLIEELISYLLSELVIVVFVVAASEIYFQRHITIRDTFQRFVNISPRYLVNVFIYLIPLSILLLIGEIVSAGIRYFSMVILISLLLLTQIVRTYFLIIWQLYAPVIVVEGSMKPKPMRRSRALIRKSWWRVFGTIFTLKILLRAIRIIFVVSFVLLLGMFGLMGDAPVWDIVEYVLRSSIGFLSGKPPPFQSGSTSYIILMSLYSVIGILIKPLHAIAITLIYFNQRVKREGFDIEMKISQDDVLRQ
ncbi:hypothetical protein C6496_13835 [Candidatus Poribacteria bacterium]|nr:MAG: hypothetical protein C6496_13835 [Candidatus Poribacteria bacterium]